MTRTIESRIQGLATALGADTPVVAIHTSEVGQVSVWVMDLYAFKRSAFGWDRTEVLKHLLVVLQQEAFGTRRRLPVEINERLCKKAKIERALVEEGMMLGASDEPVVG